MAPSLVCNYHKLVWTLSGDQVMAAMVLPNHKSISRRATRPPPPAVMLAAPLPWDQPYSHRTQLALLPPTEALRSAFPLNYTMEKEQRRHINEENRMPSAISQRKPLNIQPQATAMLAPHRHRTGTDVVKPLTECWWLFVSSPPLYFILITEISWKLLAATTPSRER